MNRIPSILEDSRWWDQAEENYASQQQRVEDFSDNLMSECITLKGAERINNEYDLYDGNLLECLMVEVANWTGSTESATTQMKKLHNLLADALQEVAEREIKP